MKQALQDYFAEHKTATPAYVLEETLLRRNLETIRNVARKADVEIILAYKAYALWRTFPIFREYIESSTASSLFEARMAYEKMGTPAHTYAPVYNPNEIDEILGYSSHITFNTLAQYERFSPHVERLASTRKVSCGVRVNPQYSEIETALYNPCAPGSRFGVTADRLPKLLPDGIEGLHFHTHCESDSYALERTLERIVDRFDPYLKQVKWVNMGGGHLMTRADYNTEHLVSILQAFRKRYPHLQVILEPGSAFAWQAGSLVARVMDITESEGINTLMADVSFTCHMPDCLEMPYMPAVRGASLEPTQSHTHSYRIGGCSCLSGDFLGNWYFDHKPKIDDLLVFEDMLHYTTVKTTMFNGVHHPSIYLHDKEGNMQLLRTYTYEDYLARMD